MENQFSIKGTLYRKDFNEVQGVKDPTQVYKKYIITLEVTSSREITSKGGEKLYKSITELPQFEAFGMSLDEFEVGDLIEIRFFLQGKTYMSKKTGREEIMTKPVITFVKFADIESHPPKKPLVKEDVIFAVPDPQEVEDDLPF